MSTERELEEVHASDADDLDAGEVAEHVDNTVVLGVHDERAVALAMTAVAHLSLREEDTFSISADAPSATRSATASCVFLIDSTAELTTRGTSSISSMRVHSRG